MSREPAKERMIEYLPWYYQASKVMGAILSSQGQELDKLFEAMNQALEQFFIPTATWRLSFWEGLLGLPVDETLPLDERRQKVLSKRRSSARPLLITLRAIALQLNALFGGDIIPFVLPIDNNTDEYDFAILVPTLERHKPAHKAYSFQLLPPDQDSGYTVYVARDANQRNVVKFELLSSSAFCGRWPRWNSPGHILLFGAAISVLGVSGRGRYFDTGQLYSGGIEHPSNTSQIINMRTALNAEALYYIGQFLFSGINETGTWPEKNSFGYTQTAFLTLQVSGLSGFSQYAYCGKYYCGEEAA